MKRGSWWIACVALVTLAACQQKQQPQPVTRAEEPRESLAELDAAPPLEPDPYADDDWSTRPAPRAAADPVVADRMAEEDVVAQSPPPDSNQRIHIIRKGDTLYKLAREYYGDVARWKDIWAANKTHLQSPDKLEVGLKLVIP